ncbi:MAG: tetraacyldisaccharide 4-kinase [Nevskia sp.]|nr:tetraacyldisaccharide 4-kinase [Nevskia sp.]
MQRWLERIWYRDTPPPGWLRPLARFYAWLSTRIAARKRAHAQHLSVPVIVVGNIAIGGTGKTPVTLWLVQELLRMGRRPGIVSRGYGGVGPFPREVSAESATSECGDEPVLLASRIDAPVIVAPDRVAAAQLLLQQYPQTDVLICDDGLQHYALARDFEICVIDGARGYGNGCLLPAGPLRETKARAQAVQLLLINGGDTAPYGERAERFDLRIGEAINLLSGEARPLTAFADSGAAAIAGIGNPQRFFAALRASGLEVDEHGFPDHYVYSPEDLFFAGDAPLLMTEKDAVKCQVFARPNWWQVPAQLQFGEAAAARIRAQLQALLSSTAAAGVHQPSVDLGA